MQQEVLTIQVVITGEARVQGAAGEAGMVAFTGTVDCPNFHGVILPGGVDTQRMVNGICWRALTPTATPAASSSRTTAPRMTPLSP